MTTAQPQPKPLRVNVSRHVSAFFSYLVWKSRLNFKSSFIWKKFNQH